MAVVTRREFFRDSAAAMAGTAIGGLIGLGADLAPKVAHAEEIRMAGEQGAGMALAGLLLGWAAVALGVIAILAITLLVVTHSGHAAGISNAHVQPVGAPPPLPAPQAP